MHLRTGARILLKMQAKFGRFPASKWGPKWHPKSLKNRPRRPRPAQKPPGALQGPILASFWTPRGVIFEPSRRPVRRLRAPRHTIERTVRNHWSKGLSRPLQARCAQGRWLSGRFGGASPTGDPATEPCQAQAWPLSEARSSTRKQVSRKAQRLP